MDYIDQYIFDPAGLNGGGIMVNVGQGGEGQGGGGEKEDEVTKNSRLAIPGGLTYTNHGGGVAEDDDMDIENMANMAAGSNGKSNDKSSESGSNSRRDNVSESIISDDLFDSLLKRVYTPNVYTPNVYTPNVYTPKKMNITKSKTKQTTPINKRNRTKKVSSK
jgi:hypothetical protein